MAFPDCIPHSGYINPKHGYGVVCKWQKGKGKSKGVYAHRLAWEAAHGTIPKGMSVCHRCDNPACVNVEHLFLGSHSDNIRDCALKKRHNMARKEVCPMGHPYDATNTYVYAGRRACKTCRIERTREWRKQQRSNLVQRITA